MLDLIVVYSIDAHAENSKLNSLSHGLLPEDRLRGDGFTDWPCDEAADPLVIKGGRGAYTISAYLLRP